MAIYTTEINTNYNIPNITVYNKLKDGVLSAYQVIPNEGYVMYDSTANDTEPVLDENGDFMFDENGEMIVQPTRYYCRLAGIPLRLPNKPYDYVAVLETEVPADHIYGAGNDKEHEVM